MKKIQKLNITVNVAPAAMALKQNTCYSDLPTINITLVNNLRC